MMNGSGGSAEDRKVSNNAVREQNYDAETIRAQSTLTENMVKLMQAGLSAKDLRDLMGSVAVNKNPSQIVTSKTQIPIPKIQKGMSFEDYKDLVNKWECMTDIPKRKRAMILTMELPLNDPYGGLHRAVRNKFKNEELKYALGEVLLGEK